MLLIREMEGVDKYLQHDTKTPRFDVMRKRA